LVALVTTAAPCGFCRQCSNELRRAEKMMVRFPHGDGWVDVTLAELLPFSFGPEDLGMSAGGWRQKPPFRCATEAQHHCLVATEAQPRWVVATEAQPRCAGWWRQKPAHHHRVVCRGLGHGSSEVVFGKPSTVSESLLTAHDEFSPTPAKWLVRRRIWVRQKGKRRFNSVGWIPASEAYGPGFDSW